MDISALEKICIPCVERHGAHLIDLVVRGEHRSRVLELYIDREEGVTADVCAEISRDVSSTLRHGVGGTENWRLMVSSPGVDRPLRYPWQYKKHIGRTLIARVKVQDEITSVSGKLISTDENGLVLEGAPAERLTFDAILEARVKAAW